MSLGPLDLTGGPFVILYFALLFGAIGMGALIPRWMRPAGRRQDLTDPEELALLVGGTTRLTEAVVTKLLASDALTMRDKDRYEPAPNTTAATAAERSVLAGPFPSKWAAIRERVSLHAPTIARKLIGDGLMIDDAQARRVRFRQTAPYFLLLCLGVAKLIVELMHDRPVGYVAMLLVFTVVAAGTRWFSLERATDHGKQAIVRAQDRSSRLRSAPMRAEAGMAVALFGTTVLIGSGLADFHQARAASSGDGGSSGCGGGGGCGGCEGD